MPTREIPRSDWARYLATLSGRRAERPVRVRIEDAEVGDQPLAECLPLVGISLERKGSEADAIEVTLAQPDGRAHLTHHIEHPVQVFVQEDEAGQVEVLDVENRAHVKTLIFFDAWQELPDQT